MGWLMGWIISGLAWLDNLLMRFWKNELSSGRRMLKSVGYWLMVVCCWLMLD